MRELLGESCLSKHRIPGQCRVFYVTRMTGSGRFPPDAVQYDCSSWSSGESTVHDPFWSSELRKRMSAFSDFPSLTLCAEGRPSAWEAVRVPPAISGLPRSSEWSPSGGASSYPRRQFNSEDRDDLLGE